MCCLLASSTISLSENKEPILFNIEVVACSSSSVIDRNREREVLMCYTSPKLLVMATIQLSDAEKKFHFWRVIPDISAIARAIASQFNPVLCMQAIYILPIAMAV